MQLIEIINTLVSRLQKAGIDPEFAPGFMKCLANIVQADSQQSLGQINERLQYLGWDNQGLDYHTLQLAVTCFEADGLESLGQISAHWADSHKQAA